MLAALALGLERFAPASFRLLSRPEAREAPLSAVQSLAPPSEGEAELTTESQSPRAMAQPERVVAPRETRGPLATEGEPQSELSSDQTKSPIPVLHPEALTRFFSRLALAERKEPSAVVRIAHFGDSIVVSDFVSTTLRRNLQSRFGDSGHGYSLIANAWPAYFHNDVYRYASRGWKVSTLVGPTAKDGWYGLGGASFRAPPGTRARFGTTESTSFGQKADRFEIWYAKEPNGGRIQVLLDGQETAILDTHTAEKTPAYHVVKTTDGPHMLELVTKGPGMVRAFGVVLERDQPGVVLDALGLLGARIRFLDNQDHETFAGHLRHRKPDLLVYQFGANESGDGYAYSMADYQRTMIDVLRRARAALPNSDCLIIGAMDRARRRDNKLESMSIIPLIVAEQAKAAAEVGCAFYDTLKAMGGPGSMRAWVRRGLAGADLTHPTSYGAQVLGDWIYEALMEAYAKQPAP
jgi:lysophospholipase L1-like esterase